jgi:hypothetical protein
MIPDEGAVMKPVVEIDDQGNLCIPAGVVGPHKPHTRFVNPLSPQHPIAARAVATLVGDGHAFYVTSQNFIEFWAVVTRPQAGNRFGWGPPKAASEVRSLQTQFPMLGSSDQKT